MLKEILVVQPQVRKQKKKIRFPRLGISQPLHIFLDDYFESENLKIMQYQVAGMKMTAAATLHVILSSTVLAEPDASVSFNFPWCVPLAFIPFCYREMPLLKRC